MKKSREWVNEKQVPYCGEMVHVTQSICPWFSCSVIWVSNLLTESVPGECNSGNASCALD